MGFGFRVNVCGLGSGEEGRLPEMCDSALGPGFLNLQFCPLALGASLNPKPLKP